MPLFIKCTEGRINESRFVMRAPGFVRRESGRRLFSKKIDGSDLMTGAGTDAASESNGNLFTLPSREEENDEVA